MRQLVYSRTCIKRVGMVGVCVLALLCLRPGHIMGQALVHQWGRGAESDMALRPLRTVRVGQNPALVAIDALDRHVFVANEGPLMADRAMPSRPGSVTMVDEGSGVVLRTVTVGRSPVALAFDAPARRVFVLAAGGINTSVGFASLRGSVSVLDAVTGALVRTQEVGSVPLTALGSGAVPSARQAMAVDSTSGRVYVAAAGAVLVLDGSTGAIRQTLELGTGGPPQIPSPSTVAVAPHAKRLYVGDGYDAALPPPSTPLGSSGGSLAVLDSATDRGVSNVVLRQQGVGAIAVDERAHRVLVVELPGDRMYRTMVEALDARTGARLHLTDLGVPADGAVAVGVDLSTSRAFVLYAPSGYELQNGGLDKTVFILNTRDGKLLQTVSLLATVPQGGFLSQAIAIDQRRGRVMVAAPQGGTLGPTAATDTDVQILDMHSGHVIGRLRVGGGAQDIAIDEVARRVFVTNEHDNTLSVFDATRL